MNYIELIRGFWRSHEENSFSTTEIAFYFYLVEVCNICRWKNPFKRNNAKIGADLGISFNTLKNARNHLQQSGLITFKTTNGSSNVLYTLSNFDKVDKEVDVEVSIKVDNEVDVEVLPTKYKLNKTETKHLKEKNKKEFFSPPNIEEVKSYCLERQNLVDPEKWFDFYQSKGWMIGKSKMKDWKAAVRTWEKSEKNGKNNGPTSNIGSLERKKQILNEFADAQREWESRNSREELQSD